jgi:hypothetical protein
MRKALTHPISRRQPARPLAADSAPSVEAPQEQRPVAIEYSDAHKTRAKIHKYASWATLPLLGAELVLGEKLYNDPGLISVFDVQSVTGVCSLVESRDAPGHRQ